MSPLEEGSSDMVTENNPHDSDSVLLVERLDLPVGISKWILVEPGNVLESSPFLSHVSWFLGGVHELNEVSVCLFG